MDSFNFDIKLEKENAIRNHRRLQKLVELVRRVVEISLVLAFFFRISFKNPFSSENSASYFKEFYVICLSPRFVFVVGNMIVLILVVKSGRLSCKDYSKKQEIPDELAAMKNSGYGMEQKIDLSNPLERLSGRRRLTDNRCNRNSMAVDETKEPLAVENSVTNEEFRCTVEAFIERHKRLRRDEI